MTTSLEHRFPRRREGIWLRQTRGENALFDSESGTLHLLNDTALAIWHLCDGDIRPAEMVAAICKVSGMHSDVVEEDVQRILREFEEARLLIWEI